MGGACIMYKGEERLLQNLWRRNMKERENWQDLSRDGRITLKWILRKLDVTRYAGQLWLGIWKISTLL